jgi:hypothetical protein
MLIAPVALLIGFFIHALILKLCFISEVGMGSVTPDLEPEISWDEINGYKWKENVLLLTLNRKWFTRKKIKFSDSTAIVAINERLRTRIHDNQEPGQRLA